MLSYADVEKLRSARAPEAAVLSLYLPVPLDPAGLAGLAAEAGDLMTAAAAGGDPGARVSRADREAVLGSLAANGREWLGRTVGFFASQDAGLFEVLPLPCPVAGRAVLAARPHVRPLLAALQRCPDYRVAVADRERAWVLAVRGGQVETIVRQVDEGLRSPGFGGWYGLQTHAVQQRVIQLGRHHYRDTAAIVARTAGSDGQVPLVIGGHRDSIAGLIRALPAGVRDAVAGSFHADPHTLTEARVRELAGPIVGSWVAARERDLAEEVLGAPGRLATVGLTACMTAVGEGAVARLLVADDEVIPGFACGRCGALSAVGGTCPACGAAVRPVPDLLEEMAQRTLDDKGQVTAIREAPFSVAAKLRFPLAGAGSGR